MDTENGKSIWLRCAAIYNLLWGAWVILFPAHFFQLSGLPIPDYLIIWQGMGMVIGVYGLGYWWAARDYRIHWPIVAVGFLGKIFGPIGFLWYYFQGSIPAAFGLMNITNDILWWIPFAILLREAYAYHHRKN